MKRRITALIFCFCILFIISVPAFAAEHTAEVYFWACPERIDYVHSNYVEVEEFDNDDPFDPGLDEFYIEEQGDCLLVGGAFRLSDLSEGSKYRFDLTLVLTPTVSINTNGNEQFFGLHTCVYSSMYGIVFSGNTNTINNRLSFLGGASSITRDSQTLTFSYTDISWLSMISNPSNLIAYYIAIPTEYISVSGDMYLANMYFGLQSDYDEEGYSQVVNEKLDEINDSLQEGNEKLDDIFNQDKDHHEAEMEQAEEHHEETKGLLESIIDGILSLPDLIKNAFKNLIDEIIGSVTSSIEDAMNGFLDNLKDKLGILYQAPDYFIRIIQSIMITETTNELTFPSMVIPVNGEEYTLNEPTPFQIFPDWIPAELYTFINLAFSIVVIFSVINYAEGKWESITNNG